MPRRSTSIVACPPMPLPVDEILRAPQFAALDPMARGMLFSLLMLAWRDGALAADPVVCARLAGLPQEHLAAYWDILTPWFMPHPSRPGHLFPPCLLEALINLTKRRLRMAAAARHNKSCPWSSKSSLLDPASSRSALEDLQALAASLGIPNA